MLLTFLLTAMLFMQQAAEVAAADPMTNLIATAITNGSIGAILFVIWYFTFKFFSKQNAQQSKEALEHNREQFKYALEQNQKQFTDALKQIESQHKESLEDTRRVTNMLFEVIRKDVDYKTALTGNLIELKSILQNLIERIDLLSDIKDTIKEKK